MAESHSSSSNTSNSNSLSQSNSNPIGAGWDSSSFRTDEQPKTPQPSTSSSSSTKPVRVTEFTSRAKELLNKVKGRSNGGRDPSKFFVPEEEDPSAKRRWKASRNASAKVAAFSAGNPDQNTRGKVIKASEKKKETQGEGEGEVPEAIERAKGKGMQKDMEDSSLNSSSRTAVQIYSSIGAALQSDLHLDQRQQASSEESLFNPTSTTPPPHSKRKRSTSVEREEFEPQNQPITKQKGKGKGRGKGKASSKPTEKVEPLTEGQVLGVEGYEGTPPPLVRDFEWPEHFIMLEKTFKVREKRQESLIALNLF